MACESSNDDLAAELLLPPLEFPTLEMRFNLLLALAAPAALAAASTLTPSVLPLLVRNPYLSTWLYRARDAPWENWPIFWTGAHVGCLVYAGCMCRPALTLG